MSNKIAVIIDDNINNSSIITTLLERVNMTVYTFESPVNIKSFLDDLTEEIAVIFLDLEFPIHNGFDVLPELKAHMKLMNTPIIAHSVNANAISDARRSGFDGFISKPIDIHKFKEHLDKILNYQPVWD